MDKKKKVIMVVILLVILLVILGIVWCFVFSNRGNNGNTNKQEMSKVSNLYEELESKDSFSFEVKLDEDNFMYYAKSGNMAYIDTMSEGRENKYIIRDGNTNLLVDETKTCYTYSNNQTNLNMFKNELEKIMDLEYQTDKEKIDNKNYTYEEYSVLSDFTIDNFTEESQDIKTRFYFEGDKLVYIKTIDGDKEELLEVNISYNVDQNLFQIPSDYTKA